VNDLPCWPNAPFFDQLVQGQQLQALSIDLEDPWANWQPVNTYTMNVGTDFDEIILATSLAPLKEICSELIKRQPRLDQHDSIRANRANQAFPVMDDADAG